jgi:hypothetical protein
MTAGGRVILLNGAGNAGVSDGLVLDSSTATPLD